MLEIFCKIFLRIANPLSSYSVAQPVLSTDCSSGTLSSVWFVEPCLSVTPAQLILRWCVYVKGVKTIGDKLMKLNRKHLYEREIQKLIKRYIRLGYSKPEAEMKARYNQ